MAHDIDDELDDEPTPIRRNVIAAPCELSIVLECPDCDALTTIVARLFARRTKDSDGTTTLALRTRAAKAAHSCGQESLGLETGPLTR